MTLVKGVHVGVVLALLSLLQDQRSIVGNSQTLTKKELKTLLANAKTSTDQQKLAAYYHEKSLLLTAQAQDFAEPADPSRNTAGDDRVQARNQLPIARATTATSQNA